MNHVITIDGSLGEGGGQVLRTALALSAATGTPCRVVNIRAGREKPGLLRQHLTALTAAAAISGARVEGAELRSTDITFEPGTVRPGDYTFSVGTAGSATLVLQTVLPPLLMAKERSTITIEGGTYNPWAPPFDFFARTFLPIVNRFGPNVEATLDRPGFYPAGGGRIRIEIQQARPVGHLQLEARGEIRARRARVLLSGLPRHIAERELSRALEQMNWSSECGEIEVCRDTVGPGNVLFLEVASDHVTEVFTGFGESGTRAETVADRAAKQARRYLMADVPVGEYLADQLLVVMALGGGGSFRSLQPSRHTRTNAAVIEQFGRNHIAIEIDQDARDVARITVQS
jgi:RNA 3'-terminal phosphate cyclase (ATP)